MSVDYFFEFPGIRSENLVAQAVPFHRPFHEFVSLGKEPARIESEDPRLGMNRACEMGQNLVLDAHARCEHKSLSGKNSKRFPDRSFGILVCYCVLKSEKQIVHHIEYSGGSSLTRPKGMRFHTRSCR